MLKILKNTFVTQTFLSEKILVRNALKTKKERYISKILKLVLFFLLIIYKITKKIFSFSFLNYVHLENSN